MLLDDVLGNRTKHLDRIGNVMNNGLQYQLQQLVLDFGAKHIKQRRDDGQAWTLEYQLCQWNKESRVGWVGCTNRGKFGPQQFFDVVH
jgi:hypothetical protein